MSSPLSEQASSSIEVSPNGGVNRAARIHESIAGSRTMRKTLPPLRFNDLFGDALKPTINLRYQFRQVPQQSPTTRHCSCRLTKLIFTGSGSRVSDDLVPPSKKKRPVTSARSPVIVTLGCNSLPRSFSSTTEVLPVKRSSLTTFAVPTLSTAFWLREISCCSARAIVVVL